MVAASLTPAGPAAAQANTPYADTPADAYYGAAVSTLAGAGVFAGTLCADAFCPDEPIDRTTMAVWTVRVLDGDDPAPVGFTRFGDVTSSHPHAAFIERFADLGVTQGCGDGTVFCPDDSVTRAQMAVVLSRAYGLPDGPDPAFSDIPAGAWYATGVAGLAVSGVTQGCGDGTVFCPDDSVTRAQMAVVLSRAKNRSGDTAGVVEFVSTLPSHCPSRLPQFPHSPPGEGCPMWWSHLLDLEPSPGGITVTETQTRLAATLPNYSPRHIDQLDRLSGPSREVIVSTLARLANDDPFTADRLRTITARGDRCPDRTRSCALPSGTINFVSGLWWTSLVSVVVHEWMHIRDFDRAPGGGRSPEWCDRIAERLTVAESTGWLVTHMALLEAASLAHNSPLVTGPGCAAALIARFAPEVPSHDLPGYILELSANAQTQVWMRRGYASAEARWWAAESAAGWPTETQLKQPLPQGPLPEPLAEPTEPGGKSGHSPDTRTRTAMRLSTRR